MSSDNNSFTAGGNQSNMSFSTISSSLNDVSVEKHSPAWFDAEFRSLQYALFLCCFFQTIGGFVFLVMSWYVLEDKEIADRAVQEANQPVSAPDLDEGSANMLEDD